MKVAAVRTLINAEMRDWVFVRRTGGYCEVPEKPGRGIEVDEVFAARPFQPEIQDVRAAVLADGTIVDW